jgi:hypothetical protein
MNDDEKHAQVRLMNEIAHTQRERIVKRLNGLIYLGATIVLQLLLILTVLALRKC